jgi:hypothetical protein
MGAIVAGCVLASWNLLATAQQDASVLVEQPEATMPAPPETAPAVEAAPAESPAVCCPAPCINYRTHLRARRMLRCQAQVQVAMLADNPADCVNCPVVVPLCIPACCTGEPVVTSHCGLLGRGIVEYCWPCGFSAEVAFRARGDIMVHYRG